MNQYALDVRVACVAAGCGNSRLSAVTIAAPNIPGAVAGFMEAACQCEKCGSEIPRDHRRAIGVHVIGAGEEAPRA